MKKRQTNPIPTQAEFEAASKFMAARIRAEEKLKNNIVSQCKSCSKFHDVYVWLPGGRCHVDLFLLSDDDLDSPEADHMRVAILKLMKSAMGEDAAITVDLDSHERVLRKYNGSYFKRFR